ncbi:methyl-accepting chemotaxis protein [Planctomycetota bacterium]|nr:methyl-accepting chemotaxis protein [Planctomycetota bacterium]
MSFFTQLKLGPKLLLASALGFGALWACVFFLVQRSNAQIIERQAQDIAATVNEQVRAARAVYTRDVVGKLIQDLPDDVHPSSDFHDVDGGVPLPAVFVQTVGQRVEQGAVSPATYSLISLWNINRSRGVTPGFAEDGFQALLAQEDALRAKSGGSDERYQALLAEWQWEPYVRVSEVDGRTTLQYLAADPASAQACVSCHNDIENDPEIQAYRTTQGIHEVKQWQRNELMGALAVDVPIDAAGAFAESKMNAVLASVTAVAAVLLCCLFLLLRRSLRRIEELTRVTGRIAKGGDLSQTLDVGDSADEIGELGHQYNAMLTTLRELSEKAGQVAAGNLGLEIDAEGDLADSFRSMVTSLRDVVDRLGGAAIQINTASQEMLSNSRMQAQGASEQSIAVEETRRTAEMLLESGSRISDASDSVLSAAERSQANNELIAERVSRLSGQTKNIETILDVIKSVADRTDILALNAGLEGVKAGASGRGFSLIADEMRNLAERVMESVKDINELMATIREATHACVLATEEGNKLAMHSTGATREISQAIKQHGVATTQVSQSMDEIHSVTLQAVAGAGETTKAAATLTEMAEELHDLVKKFKLD